MPNNRIVAIASSNLCYIFRVEWVITTSQRCWFAIETICFDGWKRLYLFTIDYYICL